MGQLLSAFRGKNKDDERNDQVRNFVQLLGVIGLNTEKMEHNTGKKKSMIE